MKRGWFLLYSLIITSIGISSIYAQQSWNEDVDQFLDDPQVIEDYKNLEGLEQNNYNFIDRLRNQKEKVTEKLQWKEPPPTKPRIFTETKPYTAQLKEGSILTHVKSGKRVKVFREVIVKAKETFVGSHQTYILDKNGNEKYTTQTRNAINIEHEVTLRPQIDPIAVYTDKSNYHSEDKDLNFSTYLGFHIESINTQYYATIYRGEKQSAQNYTIEGKTYLLTEDTPYNFGLNLQYQFGYWDDPSIGTVTWSALHIGPSFMTSFWQKKKGRWNIHLNLFKSLFHESQKNPDRHKFSSVGMQLEFEKEFFSNYGNYSLGVKYTWMKSSVKDSTEYLENIANKGEISSFGAYINYNFGWTL